MKFFSSTFSAALILMSCIPANSSKAAVHANVDDNTLTAINNNDCSYYVTRGGVTKSWKNQNFCNPSANAKYGYERTNIMFEDTRKEAINNWNILP